MTDTTSQIELLRDSKLGRILSDDQLRQLADIVVDESASAGTQLFCEGCNAEFMWVVCSGAVALEMNVPGRSDVRILSLGATDLLGWSALVGDGHMSASAIVTEHAHLLKIPASKLKELCLNDHAFGFAVMGNVAYALANRLKATRLQLLDLHDDCDAAAAKTNQG